MFVRMDVEMPVMWMVWSLVVSPPVVSVPACMSFISYAVRMVAIHNIRRNVMMQEARKTLNGDNPTKKASDKSITKQLL